MAKKGGQYVTLKKHVDVILKERQRAQHQRFKAQEKAIKTQERNRDRAITKAETSIEKKSDAVYVKLTDLQKALTEVMLRPEIESRLKGLSEKADDVKTSIAEGRGKGAGVQDFRNWILAIIAFLSVVIAAAAFIIKIK